jgi:hypothetical protein
VTLSGLILRRPRSGRLEGCAAGTSPPSRDASRPRFVGRLPSKNRRAQETPGARCTRSPACKGRKHTGVVTTGSPGHPAFPARWFYGFLRALPGDRACLPPSPHGKNPHDLTPASGRQDHTTSPSASRAVRQKRIRVHRTRSNVRDDGQRPSSGTGRGSYADDLARSKSRIFLIKGLDRDVGDLPAAHHDRWCPGGPQPGHAASTQFASRSIARSSSARSRASRFRSR